MENEKVTELRLQINKMSTSVGNMKKEIEFIKMRLDKGFDDVAEKINSNMKDMAFAKGMGFMAQILLTVTVPTAVVIIMDIIKQFIN